MADTVVMIHGMWGSGAYWGNYRGFFESRGYRVVTPTLRHHGGRFEDPPPPGLGTTSVLDYAADLEQELRALGGQPILIGHSMGGLLVQILASRGLCKAAVLLTPASPRGILALTLSVIRSFWSILPRWGFWRNPHRQTFGEAEYSMLHLLPPEERRRIYQTFCFESGRAAAEIGFWPFDLTRATAVDARKVTCPMLVIAGAEDRITPAAVVRQVARKYRADYRELPKHAHWVVGEPGWEEICGSIDTWLKQKGAH
jgi:pimeloyl-ACP methyl ester carboxylesterase